MHLQRRVLIIGLNCVCECACVKARASIRVVNSEAPVWLSTRLKYK